MVINYGRARQTLAVTRGKPRTFRQFETLAGYLKGLGIVEYRVNTAEFEPGAVLANPADKHSAVASERMKRAHQAAAYDSWIREQVQASIDDPRPSLEDGAVRKEFAAKRARLTKRAGSAKKAAPLLWRPTALTDRDVAYLAQDNPPAAIDLDLEFEAKAENARKRPTLYKPGRMKSTREIVVRPNYVMVYRVVGDAVEAAPGATHGTAVALRESPRRLSRPFRRRRSLLRPAAGTAAKRTRGKLHEGGLCGRHRCHPTLEKAGEVIRMSTRQSTRLPPLFPPSAAFLPWPIPPGSRGRQRRA